MRYREATADDVEAISALATATGAAMRRVGLAEAPFTPSSLC